jgi:membrane protease YdiL (CAAX protease family)
MLQPDTAECKGIPPATKTNRWIAILEICGIYMTGQLIAFILLQIMGIQIVNPLDTLRENPNADMLEMSKSLALILIAQYAGIMIPAMAIGWWHRKRTLSAYGFQAKNPILCAKRPILGNILTGIVLFSVSELPAKILTAVDHVLPMGAKATTQLIAFSSDWSNYKFWIFMAVGSFVLIPLVEELFFRGYVQTRLAEDYGAPTAILVTAMFFMFSHGQYYETLSPWTVGMIMTGVFSALAWGYVFYKTRSLIAPIVAHVLINFPVSGAADYILPVAMAILVVVFRKPIVSAIRDFVLMVKTDSHSRLGTIVVIIGMTLYAVLVSLSQDMAILISIPALITALILIGVSKSKKKKSLHATGHMTEEFVTSTD